MGGAIAKGEYEAPMISVSGHLVLKEKV